jgi:predicted permease
MVSRRADMAERQAQLAMAWAILFAMVIWSYGWTLVGLWKAARRGQTGWYVALAIFCLPGLLAMLYVFFVAPRVPEIGEEGEFQ